MRSNAPQRHNVYRCHPSLLPARSGARKVRLSRADKPFPAAFGWLAEWRFARPFGECRRDANSLAPNGPKARTLRCARQELVRVPESNTKYGGLRGITGGKPSPVVEPSISESSGFPAEKFASRDDTDPSSRCSQGRYIFGQRDCVSGTHVVVRKERAGMPAEAVVAPADPRQADLDFAGLPTCLIRPVGMRDRASPRPA